MDQVYQLQQQIQRIRDDAAQQLQRIQLICGQISNDLNSLSSFTSMDQQSAHTMYQSQTPFTSSFSSGYGQQLPQQSNQMMSMPMQQPRINMQYSGGYTPPTSTGFGTQSNNNQPLSNYQAPAMISAQGYSSQFQNQNFAENQPAISQGQLIPNTPSLASLNNQYSNIAGYGAF